MSHLTNILRQISKKASHPNSLIYSVQLLKAKQKYLVRGEIGVNEESAISLAAPDDNGSTTDGNAKSTVKKNEDNIPEKDGGTACEVSKQTNFERPIIQYLEDEIKIK